MAREVPDAGDLARSMLMFSGAHEDHEDHTHRSDDDETGPDTRYSRHPLFPAVPERFEAIRAATERDTDRYLHSGLMPVECRHCTATVEVKKLGPGYTSVQWNSGAVKQCAHFTAERESGNASGRSRGCPRLAKSILHAVAEGHLEAISSAPPPGDGID
ncbi:hypothetical protein BST33_15930 [Mycolicibacter minnesotensis]|uniref:Uncharacterized protein n=1 Tax=Mycolicibacter minnesotensis TaxID=1118379 RepID=A0A7I7R4R2_9MYCO|nr:hypothetical protein [Mycolicibacter minnesotensis]ORA98754.1 hypothetical protein BST33_15930 [Mycolicibacter minnesotensis]BBY33130.1 hypothetical protein MMIN_11910 [Mycolicibacter minnesotensis]